LQRIPKPGDSFLYQQRRFTVLEMEGRRVGAVKVDLIPEDAATVSQA
jgi:CBS domain containing-hemolysin-like protein